MNITQVENFDACDYEVHFDSTVITLTSVTNGNIGGTTIPVIGTYEIAPGRVKVLGNVPGFPGVSGSGYLADLHFHVVGSSGSSSTINLEEGCLSDNTATEIMATWTGDSVTVAGAPSTSTPTTTPTATPTGTATPTATPTPTLTPTPTSTPCVLFGDLNGDGDVDVEDVMLVANCWRCQLGDQCYSEDYDLDRDDDIDIVDIMLVVAHWGETCE